MVEGRFSFVGGGGGGWGRDGGGISRWLLRLRESFEGGWCKGAGLGV